MSRRLKWSLIAATAAVIIIAVIAGFIFVGEDNETARSDINKKMDALLSDLEEKAATLESTDPMTGKELLELSALQISQSFETAYIELKAQGNENVLSILGSGKTKCEELAKEYERGNINADPEPCLSAVEELKRVQK